MSFLLDTNVVCEFVNAKPNSHVLQWLKALPNERLYISVLTIGEIRKGIEQIKDGKRKQQLKLWLEHELPNWFEDRVLPIDIKVADRWGRLQHQSKRTLPAIDSLLAATALHYDLSLVTRNVKDFTGIALEIFNPWEI